MASRIPRIPVPGVMELECAATAEVAVGADREGESRFALLQVLLSAWRFFGNVLFLIQGCAKIRNEEGGLDLSWKLCLVKLPG